MTCEACGQAVDLRRLGDLLHHDESGHGQTPAESSSVGSMPASDEARQLLAYLLAGAAGHDKAYWLDRVSIEKTALVDNIRTNWRLVSKAAKRDQVAIDGAEAVVREAHPYLAW